MILQNRFINKYGTDALLHFGFGGWITSIGSYFGLIGTLITFAIMLILAYYKELKLDDYFDKIDLKWSIYGGLTSVFITLIFFATKWMI